MSSRRSPWDHEKDLVAGDHDDARAVRHRGEGRQPRTRRSDDLLAAARKDPGKLTYGTGGPGARPHFATESLMLAGNVNLLHVPYKGRRRAMTALIGGQVDVVMSSTPSLMTQVKGGKARMLAVSGDKRVAALPDVPTFAEAGLKQYGHHQLQRASGRRRHAARDRREAAGRSRRRPWRART
jgi:hypothetical protein